MTAGPMNLKMLGPDGLLGIVRRDLGVCGHQITSLRNQPHNPSACERLAAALERLEAAANVLEAAAFADALLDAGLACNTAEGHERWSERLAQQQFSAAELEVIARRSKVNPSDAAEGQNDVSVLGHGGLIDTMRHALATGGCEASMIIPRGQDPQDVPITTTALMEALTRLDAAVSVMQQLLIENGFTDLRLRRSESDAHEQLPADLEAGLSDLERSLITQLRRTA